MSRRKFVTEEEFKAILRENEPWKIVEVEKDSLPECIAGYPPEKLVFVAASASVAPQSTDHGVEVGGIDVFRHAEARDGVRYNKDHHVIVMDERTGGKWLLCSKSFRDDEHWIDCIPERFENIEVVRIRRSMGE